MADRPSTVDEAAQRLLTAYDRREPIAPLSTGRTTDLEEAYGIQVAQVRAWQEAGAVIRGYKVGLTSLAMQRMLGVSEPDYGHLTDAMLHADFDVVPMDRLLQPRIEPELAFVLSRDLRGPGLDLAEVAAAVDIVMPALEIIDSRIADWRLTLYDTIADNASSGAVVLGADAAPLTGVDLRLTGCNLWRNGEIAATGATGAVLGNPLLAVRWLANTLGAQGVVLRPGHVLLAGSCTAAVPVSAGDAVTASFAGAGSVTVSFEEEDRG